jgi:hypothetical protein
LSFSYQTSILWFLLDIVRFILVIAMADIKNKQTKKTKKKHGNDFVSRIEELKSQLSLKQDILERSDKKNCGDSNTYSPRWRLMTPI